MFRSRFVLFLGCALCWVPPALAQSSSHEIPERGAALYDREFKRETKVLEPAELETRNVGEVPNNPGSAVVLHSDLDDKARRIERAPASLLEIAPYAAFDLATRGKNKVSYSFERVAPFGALVVEGRTRKGEAGVEQITLQIAPPELGKRDAKPANSLTAELLILRHWDPERDLIVRTECTLTGQIHFTNRNKPDQIQRASFTLLDNWKLREVVGNRGARFNTRVAEAIKKGAASLEKVIEGDIEKKYPRAVQGNGQSRQTGELALILLTLLKAGGTRFDPVIKKGIDELRQRVVTDTYSLGVAMLMLEACYSPKSERDDLLSGRLSAPHPRTLTAEDRALMEEWVQAMVGNQAAGGRDGSIGWRYLASPDFDNSCSQYAVLGLYAAHLCGVQVDRDLWVGATRHFLQQQCKPTGTARVHLTTHEQWSRKRTPRRTGASNEVAGWAYVDRNREPTGSMTTAGIGSLTICDVLLRGMGRRRPKDVSGSAVRGAIRSGFAWLAENYDVRGNPGAGPNWRLYYLYGLERVCELNQIVHIQNKDWYFDGATMLLEEQNENGRWGSEIDTCFAILFLKKAALPAITGKR